MKKNKDKKGFLKRYLFNQYLLTILGLVVLLLISIPLAKIVSQRYKVDGEIKELEKEISEVENKNSGLKKVIGYMESDQFVEEQARIKFGLKKPGEEVLSVASGNNAGPATGQDPEKPAQQVFTAKGLEKSVARKATNPEKWWSYFFSKHNN